MLQFCKCHGKADQSKDVVKLILDRFQWNKISFANDREKEIAVIETWYESVSKKFSCIE